MHVSNACAPLMVHGLQGNANVRLLRSNTSHPGALIHRGSDTALPFRYDDETALAYSYRQIVVVETFSYQCAT